MKHTRCLALAISAATLCGIARYTRAADPSLFTVEDYYHVDGTGLPVLNMPGELYVPTNYNPAEKYPIVLFFAGIGEGGTNNTSQLDSNIDNLFAAAQSNNFFLFAPQSSDGNWQPAKVDTAMKMIYNISNLFNIDPTRMYVTGLSAGGEGCWQAIGAYTQTLAAAVPIDAEAGYLPAAGLVNKPIWSYEAIDDQFVTVGRNQINAIRAADNNQAPLVFPLNNSTSNPYYNDGAPYYTDGSTFYSEDNLNYTEYSSGGHSIATWGRAYAEAPMYSWLLSQKSTPHVLQPGEHILFHLGSSAVTAETTDSQGRTWNSASLYQDDTTLGPLNPYAMISTGVRSTVALTETSAFYGVSTTGVTAGSIYDANVASNDWISRAANTGVLNLTGLTPGQQYQLSLFASDSNSDGTNGRLSLYTVNGVSETLNVVNNTTNQAVFSGIAANASGDISISVAPTGTARYAELGEIDLTIIPEPMATGMMGLALCGLFSRPRRFLRGGVVAI